MFTDGRTITLASYYIAQYEVTQSQYQAIMKGDKTANAEPSYFGTKAGDKENTSSLPVENVTWYDAVYFCNKLSESLKLTPVYTITNIRRDEETKAIVYADVTADISKNGYRLPTEAEWEYAARGGNIKSANWSAPYAGSKTANDVSWNVKNSGNKTQEVGKKQANELGVFDMSGNVWEWCHDWYDYTVETGTFENPTGPEQGRVRIERGGSFADWEENTSVTYRGSHTPSYKDNYLGFRLVRTNDMPGM